MKYLFLIIFVLFAQLSANCHLTDDGDDNHRTIGNRRGVSIPIGDFVGIGVFSTESDGDWECYRHPRHMSKEFLFSYSDHSEPINMEAYAEILRMEAESLGAVLKKQTCFFSGKTGQIPMISQILEIDHLNLFQLHILHDRRIFILAAKESTCNVEGVKFWKRELKDLPQLISVHDPWDEDDDDDDDIW